MEGDWGGNGWLEGEGVVTLIPDNVISHHPIQHMSFTDRGRIPRLCHTPFHQHPTSLSKPHPTPTYTYTPTYTTTSWGRGDGSDGVGGGRG